ncbi:Iron-sulfur cluster assembly accessory protein [Lentzea waywayandensis]|uniref:Iron-sulfur cluster assembly accessory protein n=1 Tax=Lentzea waywayandensis TaxID=84724 RepID=A0A1I6FJG8_9PSEU|nr:iron-sulfur cluster assembly accessory protein [Lentzea waywayandensis]SFR30082.1 Iron-sulfur cluster assembly accessory protein [Lentzea waywayandensis]
MQQDVVVPPQYAVSLTEAAVVKVDKLLAAEGASGLALRIRVESGGCAGLRYQLYFDDQYTKVLAKDLAERADEGAAEPDDEEMAAQRAAMVSAGESVLWFDGVAVLVDKKSGLYLDGAVIDFVDTLQKQGFTIENPNAQGGCACGDSFH